MSILFKAPKDVNGVGHYVVAEFGGNGGFDVKYPMEWRDICKAYDNRWHLESDDEYIHPYFDDLVDMLSKR